MFKNKKYIVGIVFFCFFVLTLFLSINKHSKAPQYSYQSELWADKAGYYVYLPLAINYKLDASQLPDSIEVKIGNGFNVNKNKLKTKYTSGVAIMQLPFYLIANSLAKPLGFKQDGFSKIYYWSINFSAVFYLIVGLYFLRRFLLYYYINSISSLVVLMLFLATNLYYYAVDETGMSHVYSFALFSVFLFLLKHSKFLTKSSITKNFIVGLVIGLIILIRPTNIIFLSTYLFIDIDKLSSVKNRFKNLLLPRVTLPIILGAVIILIPQLLYWNYAYGSYINYSYANEHFNWLAPQLTKTFFSPNNGLFLYTPFYIILLFSVVVMIKNKVKNGIFVLGIFISISYVFSCWWDWSFGCGFGARSYVEYLALFSISLGYLIKEIYRNKIKLILFSIAVLLAIGFNFKMIYSYDECFEGKNEWDWQAYKTHVLAPTK